MAIFRENQIVKEIILLEKIQKKQYKRIESVKEIRERKWTSMRRQQSSMHRRKNLCFKQLEDSRANFIKES